ncbi:hypothetical protein NKG99_20440 [Mesorhizobium sp. M1409]|uniref:hypothetical protein n=1 Tax=Mesorhizobium sp. M1409 TaxID=2957100 RepID=UPI00333C4373
MAQDQEQQNPPNGAAPPAQTERKSLRQIAEETWDEVADEGGNSDDTLAADEAQGGQEGQPRDTLGRFAAKAEAKPGEQSAEDADPAPPQNDDDAPGEAKPADPAQGSNQPPQHWPEQARKMFARLDPEGQTFLLDRHRAMEQDYQAKAQANATAVQFTQALAPVFQDPVISGSLQQAGASPFDAIAQWAGFHKRAMDPNPDVRFQLWQELGQRMGLNSAATGQMSQSGLAGQLSEDDLKDPAIRYFADHLGKTFNDVQALRGELHQMRQQDAQRQTAEVQRVTRWGIDSFADEKDQQGNLLHPHFDAVLPQIIELFRANPDRDLREAYETALWMVPTIRQGLVTAAQSAKQKEQDNRRARQAVRSNVRGITSPVSKPQQPDGKAQGLRATLEASADEVGI